MNEWMVGVEAGELDRIVVVSPHFDDAVMGAGDLLAAHPGSTVVTVMAGPPDEYPAEPTEWDARGGFGPGDDVVALRREEDAAAMAVLGAETVWLPFVDHQYLPGDGWTTAGAVAPVLLATLDALEPTAVFVPFGLANPDHDVVHRAARIVMDERPDRAWFCYEDAGYKHLPGLLAWRVGSLLESGRWWPTPAIVPVAADPSPKLRALECYRSQLQPLREDHALAERLAAGVPEQHWRLAAPPAGWEALVSVPG